MYQGAPAGRSGRGRRPLLIATGMVIVVVAVAAALFLVPRTDPERSPTATATTAGVESTGEAPPETTQEATPEAGGGSSGNTELEVGGYANGPLVSPHVQCTRQTDSSWTWTVTGAIDGSPLEINFTTNYYRGSADYNVTGITDEQGGQLTVYAGTVSFVSNATSSGTLTVAADEQSGTISADIEDSTDPNQRIQLNGSWRCS